ncbi:hypothetical protein [Vibrio injensis]|uniref:hypothetical protein n=1 Tax=Vibrio injensis TaxID=1307414 RepID=UPI00278C3791|nr:hypothetical protein [Vibrio injensis]
MVKLSTKDEFFVYHLVQPYFFAHHHFHIRKIEVLRKKGIRAKILSLVPKSLYEQYHEHYDKIVRDGNLELLIVPGNKFHTLYLLRFLLFKIVKKQKVLIHVLRSSPWAVVLLKCFPFFKSHLCYIQEFEGDACSEYIYAKEYKESPRPPEQASNTINKIKSKILLNLEKIQVFKADGLVLMSQEHASLWQSRVKKSLHISILPTVADSTTVWFDKHSRNKIRSTLKIDDFLVLTYTGNVICYWQRREAMCHFVAKLYQKEPKIHFLAIVRKDDNLLMSESLKKYGIEKITTLITVDHSEIYKYLSAADLGLFLRHNHTMNKVVTSGKLGEYLSAGLPVLTTGNNADVLNQFIKKHKAGYFIDDSLNVTEDIITYIRYLINEKNSSEIREKICLETKNVFDGEINQFSEYVKFIKSLIGSKL